MVTLDAVISQSTDTYNHAEYVAYSPEAADVVDIPIYPYELPLHVELSAPLVNLYALVLVPTNSSGKDPVQSSLGDLKFDAVAISP